MTWPDAVPFDPLQGTASRAVEALLKGPAAAAPVIVLAVGPLARKQGWAARAAIVLAEAFARVGGNVILADLSLRQPELHELLGSENEEGLTDVFLFGASLDHTTRTLAGKTFRLIPASPFTPDPSAVLQHERWAILFEELAQTESKLLAYLPADVEAAASFSDRVGYTIVLAYRREFDMVRAALSDDAEVVAVLTPAVAKADATKTNAKNEPTKAVSAPPPTARATGRLTDSDFEKIRIPKDAARETLIADLRKRQRAALMAPPPEMTPLPQDAAPAAPQRFAPTPRRPGTTPRPPAQTPFTLETAEPAPRTKRNWHTWALLILLVAAVGAAVWFLWLESQFGAVRRQPELRSSPNERITPAPVTPTAAGTALPYSVAVASYQVLNLAGERVAQLQEQQPELSFYIGPIAVQGTLFYRVMAGPVADSARAVALRDALVDVRIKTGSSGWDVLATPYAFLLGEFAERDDAEAMRRETLRSGVPSYVIPIAGPAGSQQYRLYAGAFAGPGDAEFMRQILKDAGLPDNLVERIGSH